MRFSTSLRYIYTRGWKTHDGSVCMPYMVTFTINIPTVANYPRVASGWNNPGDLNGISGGNVHLYLGWTNPLTKWDEPPSTPNVTIYSIHGSVMGYKFALTKLLHWSAPCLQWNAASGHQHSTSSNAATRNPPQIWDNHRNIFKTS